MYQQNIDYLPEKTAGLSPGIRFIAGPAGESSTLTEALRTRAFIRGLETEGRSVDSLLLVTSPYHSYRASWLFSRVLTGYEVISTPVPYDAPWKVNGNIDETHRHVRYAEKERRKFAASYVLYGLLFQ